MSEAFPLNGSTGAVAVAVVADDEVTMHRIGDILARDGLAVSIELGGQGDEAVEGLKRVPDVVVIAGSAANAHQVWTTVARVRRRLPTTRTVVIAPTVAGHDVRRMVEAGADGLVLERRIDSTLAIAIRAACAGQVCTPRVTNHLVEAPALSYREKQILSLAISGLSNSEIAGRLYLAESTVKSHLSSAFRRLGVRSRREAAAFILGADESLRRTVLIAPQFAEQQP